MYFAADIRNMWKSKIEFYDADQVNILCPAMGNEYPGNRSRYDLSLACSLETKSLTEHRPLQPVLSPPSTIYLRLKNGRRCVHLCGYHYIMLICKCQEIRAEKKIWLKIKYSTNTSPSHNGTVGLFYDPRGNRTRSQFPSETAPGVSQAPLEIKNNSHVFDMRVVFYDPRGNRTPVTAVKGRCLSRLTIGP